jgi:hypothetical protein
MMSGSNFVGEWLQLQMPQPIQLTSYKMFPSSNDAVYRNATDWVVGGSRDGVNWTLLDKQSNVQWTQYVSQTFNLVNNSNTYQFYRIQASRVGNSNTVSYREAFFLGELYIYGYDVSQVPPNERQISNEIINCDRTLFDRPITINRASNGVDVSKLGDWSCRLCVFDDAD